MAQALMAGMTNYSEQTINDIKDDIENWIKYCNNIKEEFEANIAFLSENDYWETKVPMDFRAFCLYLGKICDTFSSDFELIIKAIDEDRITSREISLMKNIYKVSCENEEYCWRTYKNFNEDGQWHEYGNPLFAKVEKLYGDGRDFLVSLRDVSNAAARMEDYMKEENAVNVSVNGNNNSQINIGGTQNVTDNSINIGDNNEIKNSVIGNANKIDNGPVKESFFHKYMWPILSGVAIAVIAALICLWLGLK